MNLLSFTLILAVLQPVFAFAGDNSCYQKQRDQFLVVPEGADGGVVTNQQYLRSTQYDGTVKLIYKFRLKVNGVDELIAYDFSIPQSTSATTLNVKMGADVFSGLTRYAHQEWNGAYMADCQSGYTNTKTYAFAPVANGGTQVKIEKSGAGVETAAVEMSLSAEETLTGAMMDMDQDNSYFRQAGMNHKKFASTMDNDVSYSRIQVSGSEVPPIKRENPESHVLETLTGVKLQIAGADTTLVRYANGPGNVVSQINIGKFTIIEESLSREAWLKLVPQASRHANFMKVTGFTNEDLKSDQLRYTISGPGKAPADFNTQEYFTKHATQSTAGWQWTITGFVARPSLNVAWNAAVDPADRKYLAGSKYIQLDKVASIVEEVRPKLAGLNRTQAAKAIAEVLATHVKYDYDALYSGLNDMRTTEDVLKTGKGVCMHYSMVFVAIARALGIPARLIQGWAISAGKADPHAWVEVKTGKNLWWPVDPQIAAEALDSHGYVPMSEMRSFEAETETGAGGLSDTIGVLGMFTKWSAAEMKKSATRVSASR